MGQIDACVFEGVVQDLATVVHIENGKVLAQTDERRVMPEQLRPEAVKRPHPDGLPRRQELQSSLHLVGCLVGKR
jgi:hypothetical protein